MIAIISGVFGLIGGTVASLVAPWVQWGIEKRRNKMTYRRQLVESWREYIDKNFNFNQNDFAGTATFSTLRPHLSKKLIKDIEDEAIQLTSIGSSTHDSIKLDLLQEITRIEKRWGLI